MNSYFQTNIRPEVTIKPRPVELRVYYDPITKICTHKTTAVVPSNDNYIVTNPESYNSIDICSNYQVIDDKIERVEAAGNGYKNLIPDDAGRYLTIKNNMIFVVDSLYTGETDRWGYRCS